MKTITKISCHKNLEANGEDVGDTKTILFKDTLKNHNLIKKGIIMLFNVEMRTTRAKNTQKLLKVVFSEN